MPEVVLPEWTLARLRSSVMKAHRQIAGTARAPLCRPFRRSILRLVTVQFRQPCCPFAARRAPATSRWIGSVAGGEFAVEDCRRSSDFLGKADEKSFGPADVAQPIRVFVLDHFPADELRAVLTEPGERVVDVGHGEH